jgi:DNA protecting protein DprA
MNTSNHERLQKVRGIGPKRYQNVLTKLDELGKSLDDLFKMPAAEIKSVFNLPRNVAEAIASTSGQSQTNSEIMKEPEEAIDQLAAKSIKTLKRGSPDYPKRLEVVLDDKAPPILYAWGNLKLLEKPAVGFCGSRDASEESIVATADTAKQIADLGWVVVSGHARGVDTKAHLAALQNGGSTIIVAPEGLLNFKLRQELKKIAKPEQILIISEFDPKARWSVINAMTRNRTIIGLSDAMILVEARMEGGTFQAGETTLYFYSAS